jgi:hypothetical protein
MARVLHVLLTAGLLCAGATAPAAAEAQDEEAGPAVDPEDLPERPVPDYDNRGEAPTTAGDVLLWVPRIVFSPLYLVSEFVLRRPLGWLVTTAELNEWPTLLIDFFTFGEEQKAGVVPTALIDFGFRPSVGVYAFGDDFLFDDNDLRIHAATWGLDWLTLTVTNRTEIREDAIWLALRGYGERRTDWLFYGLGPRSHEDDETRFQQTEIGAEAIFEASVWRASSVVWWVGVRSMDFEDEACCDEPSILQEHAPPPGWQGYTGVYQAMELSLDTRLERPAPGSGIRLEIEGEQGFDLRDPTETRWIRYGGTLGAYWDPSGLNRVIGLSLSVEFADPVGGGFVPFTEQVSLGGTELMRGFLEGRLIGRSAVVATFEYRWPVWIWLDGTFHAAVGNVFGEHLDGFDPDLLRLSFGVGFRTVQSRDHSFDVLLAFGSEPFENFEISSARLLFGTTRGF